MRMLLTIGLAMLLGCQEPAPAIPQPSQQRRAATPAPQIPEQDTVQLRANYKRLPGSLPEFMAFGALASKEYNGQTLRCIQWLDDPGQLLCSDTSRRGENGLGELVYFRRGEKADYIVGSPPRYIWNHH